MKILHLLKHGQFSNGNVHVAVDVACAQSASGHDVVFAAAQCSFTELMESHGVRVVELPEPVALRQAAPSARHLWRLCRDFRPDVINAHMMSSAVLAYPIAKVLGTPLLTTMHNSFDGHLRLMCLGRVVIAVSDAERRLLLSRGYRASKEVTVVNGAIDSPRETDAPSQVLLPSPCVVSLGGLHPRKAVHDVVSAFARVAPRFPDWHLDIIGGGADEDRLQAMVNDLGLREQEHLLGYASYPRLLLEEADIFATATLADPCPLAVMEARAAGCAAVATAVSGIPEMLLNGEAGRLVPTRDPAAMAREFEMLMANPLALHEWQRRARTGSDYSTVERMSRDHVKVYESLLANGGVFRPAGVPQR